MMMYLVYQIGMEEMLIKNGKKIESNIIEGSVLSYLDI